MKEKKKGLGIIALYCTLPYKKAYKKEKRRQRRKEKRDYSKTSQSRGKPYYPKKATGVVAISIGQLNHCSQFFALVGFLPNHLS